MKRHIILALAFLASLCGSRAFGQLDGLAAPGPADRHPVATTAATTYIRLYQRFLSPLRGSRCAMYPSCSAYGMEAVRRKPFAVAMALTADRMLRCGHDGRYYDLTYAYGYPSLIDLLPGDTVPRILVAAPRIPPLAVRSTARTARDSVTDFVRHLINRKDYTAALLEAERIAYFRPELNDSALFLLRMLCYDGLDREEDAFAEYHTDGGRVAGRSDTLLLQMAKMYHEVGNYDAALRLLGQTRGTTPELRRRVALRATTAALRAGREELARKCLAGAEALLTADQRHTNEGLFAQLARRRPRRPLVAGLLSSFPAPATSTTASRPAHWRPLPSTPCSAMPSTPAWTDATTAWPA